MKRLIYQVAVGAKSNLYEHCIDSAAKYAEKYGADHIVQRQPKLRIAPDIFRTHREGKTGGWKKMGYLPIFEKENAFELLEDYDQILILDADIYIRPTASNIFEELGDEFAFGGVNECDMPITAQHSMKIHNYSRMQYTQCCPLGSDISKRWRYHDSRGFAFYNMGLMLLNSAKILPYLRGQTPRQFLLRSEFQDMLDGVGNYKWSTDQTLLNYWLKKENIPCKNLDWKYNGLYSSLRKGYIEQCDFVHFYLKDKLPENGENTAELMGRI
jgi:lipopolysaccharide biosynthesis glycosyltransferase|tara:strand:+ start:2467 stop:3276 length:810 start_codon:yes stop_codon:yes gene_type:complete